MQSTKMEVVASAGGKVGGMFFGGLLLLEAVLVSLSNGQAGVSLRYGGETIPNNSFVDFDDVLNIGSGPGPTNRNPGSNGAALECITDLVDCCGTESGSPVPRTQHGFWYFPVGTRVGEFGSGTRFMVNRGPNEVITGQQVYGSVRLFRRFSGITERGRFRCELPNAANPSINQILYVNILNFASRFDVPHVTTSSSGSNTAGTVYSLMCSSTLNSDSSPLPVNVPAPTFMWSFGPSGSDPLPSGVTDMGTTSSGATYTSTLQFSPLSQCHIGNYTCRLGPVKLVTSTTVTVNGFQITTSGAKVLGQSGYSLICGEIVTGTADPTITYQWTKNNGNGTQTPVGTDDRELSFSPLRLSDAGQYTCQATVTSPCSVTQMDTQDVTLQIPAPTSVTLSSSIPNPISPFGSDVTLTCAVELNPAVNVPVTVNIVLTTDEGFMRTSIAQSVMGSLTNYASEFTISPFGRSDSGMYICSATVSLPSNAFISDSSTTSHSLRVTTGVYLALRDVQISNNSNINTKDIGENPSGALQCITDNLRCCSQNPALGEWYQPNGALVQGTTSTMAFYRTRGANGEVSLNRPSDVESPTGQFCCEVPDTTNTNQTLCVNIGGASITIPSDPPIAGESYTLECSAGGSQAESFQWLKGPPDGRTPVVESRPNLNIISNATTSQLQFRPIGQSDNGSYSCNASVGGLAFLSESVNITVNAPSVSVQITDGEMSPTAGLSYQLTCSVSGDEQLRPDNMYNVMYMWTKNSSEQIGMNSDLSLSPLLLSNAANYTCQVTISSMYLEGTIVAMNINPFSVRITIPTLSSIALSNGGASEIVMFGADVTLTCTLEFNSAIAAADRSLLIIDVQLSRDGSQLGNPTRSTPTGSGTTFTYTRRLESFGRNDSGNYTCMAEVRPQPTATYLDGNTALLSSITRVTTGVYLSLNGQVFTNNSEILVSRIGDRMEGGGVGEALLCYTDSTQCCNDIGGWVGPSGGNVGDEGGTSSGDFYVTRESSIVRLHRRNNTSPSGIYCCQVPDARSKVTRVCANIVLQLTPTESPQQGGNNIAPAAAGGAVAGLAVVIILIVIIIIVVMFLRRRSSSKPYEVSKTKSSVLYSKQKNGDQVFGVATSKQPKILKFPSDTNITEGEGVYFRIKVSGEPQPTVTWYHDGEPVRADYAREIESDGSLTIPSTELKHSGVYKAVAANSHGSEQREIKLTVSEDGAETAIDLGEMVKSRPIPIPEFGEYVSELHSNSNKPFKELYEALDRGEHGHSTSYATEPRRKPLNRFGNIIVYDDNRIVLQPLGEYKDCQGDYINACYIDGYSVPNKFIATQGPIPKTVVDFWRLIWQEHPPTIVMVTNVKEGSKIKCQRYWPESGQESYGPFQVIIADQQIFADYTVRTLSVSLGSGGRSHKVTQYHFTAWPDHGVPDYATPILAFHRRVKAQHHPSRGPMVVHCSAGVGRTGTFIVIDNILEQIEKEQVVDIPGAITKIRQRRMKMVQTHDQFTFIHDAILESVTCGDTQISATNLRATIVKLGKKAGFQHQMKVLEQVSPNPDEVQCNTARSHPDRNRGERYLPADRWRVILKGEQPDYIHAVSINGYKHQRAFIIAQGPLQSTVRNFWKMVYDRKSAVIVMVSDLTEGGQEASAQYWPNSGVAEYGGYAVDLLGEEPLQGFTIRTLSVMDKKTQKAHQVTQFHITCWRPDGHCSNLKSVTDVIEEMTKVQIRSGNKPIVVHCSDTVTRSGMFCAIATTIERCKTEGVVDVFQVVKALRVQKPGAVPTVEQYQQIFETALVFLESFDTYANFQM